MRAPPALAVALLLAALGAREERAAAQGARANPRSSLVVDAALRSGAVPRCWNAYLQSNAEASSARFRVRIELNDAGAFHRVTVLDPAPPPLVGCVQAQLARLSIPRGEAIVVVTTYSFAAGMPAPVPAGASASEAPPGDAPHAAAPVPHP
jgi:hypothetical protein